MSQTAFALPQFPDFTGLAAPRPASESTDSIDHTDSTDSTDSADSTDRTDRTDRIGFDIGWDHARHSLVPPPELLLAGTPVCQGWLAGKTVFARRCLAAGRFVRQWLTLRTSAWRHGIHFEAQHVTPKHLAQLHTDDCPVLRLPLGGAAGEVTAAVVDRLNPLAGYAAGNLVVMSLAASQLRQGLSVTEAVRRARTAEVCGQAVHGHAACVWWRLATLGACGLELPFHEVARLPLAALPPNCARLLNGAQGLQALVTQLFTQRGWSIRAKAVAALLPEHTLRHDFHLFLGAMAPRVLEAAIDASPAQLRRVLEDAWLNERVQRRWTHLVLSLGAIDTDKLLARAAGLKLAGVRTLQHAQQSTREQATAGSGLPHKGRSPAQRTLSLLAAVGVKPAVVATVPMPPKNKSLTMGARLS